MRTVIYQNFLSADDESYARVYSSSRGKNFIWSDAYDIVNPRYVQQQLFRNIQQQLCTSSVGDRVIASSIFSELVGPPRESHHVQFSGDRQVINGIIPLFF